MRSNFGGRGSRNGRRHPYFGISFELGPVASAIASVFFIIAGLIPTFLGLISFNIILLVIGVVFVVAGVYEFRKNVRIIKMKKHKKELNDEEE